MVVVWERCLQRVLLAPSDTQSATTTILPARLDNRVRLQFNHTESSGFVQSFFGELALKKLPPRDRANERELSGILVFGVKVVEIGDVRRLLAS